MPRFVMMLSLVALAACAGSGARAGGPATEEDLPLAQVLDSAALVEAMRALPPRPAEMRVPSLFTVRWDSAGRVKDVGSFFREDMPAGYAAPILTALRASARPMAPGKGYLAVLYLEGGPRPRVEQAGDLRESRPELLDRHVVASLVTQSVDQQVRLRPELAGRRYHTELRMRVGRGGSADSVLVARSSGHPDLDREAALVARRMRFRPATIEGHPVAVWIQLPIVFDFTRIRGANQD